MTIATGQPILASDINAAITAAAGDILLQSADTQRTHDTTTYTKIKEMQLAFRGGIYRIKFDLKGGGGVPSYGRIYRNGGAVGTEQSDSTGSYVNKSEDISGWASGDLVQLYAKITSGGLAYVQNFRIYATIPDITTVNTD